MEVGEDGVAAGGGWRPTQLTQVDGMAAGKDLTGGGAGAQQLPAAARVAKPEADAHIGGGDAPLVDIATAQGDGAVDAGWTAAGLKHLEVGDIDADALGIGLVIFPERFDLAAGVVEEIAVEPLPGGEVELIEVEAEPRELLDEAVAVAGQAGLTVGGVEHEVKAGEHVAAHGAVGEAMILGEQDAILGDQERLVAIAIVLHPLAEVADAALEGLDVAMFAEVGGAGDCFAGIGFESRRQTGAPATAFGEDEAMGGPDVDGHGAAIALLVLG